jgi:hypothetical protein
VVCDAKERGGSTEKHWECSDNKNVQECVHGLLHEGRRQ